MWNPCGVACVPEHRCVTGEWKNNKQVNSWLGCTICKKCELTHLSDCGLKIHCLGKIAVFPSKLYSVLAEHSCEVCFSLNICYFFPYTWLGWLTPANILQPSRSLMSSYASVEVYWNLWFVYKQLMEVLFSYVRSKTELIQLSHSPSCYMLCNDLHKTRLAVFGVAVASVGI